MGAPVGNKNGAKAKQWAAAIERALERQGDPSIDPDKPVERAPRMKALDAMADKFLASVLESGVPGFKEFGDRLDGKPAQQLNIAGHDGEALVVRFESGDEGA